MGLKDFAKGIATGGISEINDKASDASPWVAGVGSALTGGLAGTGVLVDAATDGTLDGQLSNAKLHDWINPIRGLTTIESDKQDRIEAEALAAKNAATMQFNTDGSLNEEAAQLDPRKIMGQLTLAMSDDFFKTAVPVKNDLIKMTTYNGNNGIVDGLKSQGMAEVKQSFTNAQGRAERNTQRYGMELTKEQRDARATALSSGQALAEVDTTNRATQYQQDLNRQLVSGMSGAAGISK